MTVMDIERTMQFIVEQQAQLTASAQRHEERLARTDEQIAKHSEQISKLGEQIAKHSEQISKLGEQVGTLIDLVGRLAQAEIRIVERMEKMDGRQQEMQSAMTRLFERLDRFIQGLEGDGHRPR